MRKSFLLFSVLALTVCVYAQQPFAKYGYKVKVATFSGGRYDEFHDKTRIVEIGSVKFDTKTGKIVGYVDNNGETEDGMKAQTVSRFLSIDPLAEKYYSISPYAYCLNNPLKYVDPSGRDVVATTLEAQRMILNTLPKSLRQHVQFDNNGYINQDNMRDVSSKSQNFNSLKTMVLSDRTVEVILDDKITFADRNGNIKEREMQYSKIDDFFIGNDGGKGVGASTGETGFLGKTLFPDRKGDENSPNNNIIIVVNSQLTEQGRAEMYSHEANGHGYVYVITNGDRKKASHDFSSGNTDLNRYLFNLINKSMNETIENMR